MNPKEFQQRVADHFKNITPEEFLVNLRESSPYLFTEEQKKIPHSTRNVEPNTLQNKSETDVDDAVNLNLLDEPFDVIEELVENKIVKSATVKS